jgi:hypothetical protein
MLAKTNVIPLRNYDRLVEDMAFELLNVPKIGDDRACILHLVMAGFLGRDVGLHLDAARDLARDALAVP